MNMEYMLIADDDVCQRYLDMSAEDLAYTILRCPTFRDVECKEEFDSLFISTPNRAKFQTLLQWLTDSLAAADMRRFFIACNLGKEFYNKIDFVNENKVNNMDKKALYESIMMSVAKEVKKAINESEMNGHDYYIDNNEIIEDDTAIGEIWDDGTVEFYNYCHKPEKEKRLIVALISWERYPLYYGDYEYQDRLEKKI